MSNFSRGKAFGLGVMGFLSGGHATELSMLCAMGICMVPYYGFFRWGLASGSFGGVEVEA